MGRLAKGVPKTELVATLRISFKKGFEPDERLWVQVSGLSKSLGISESQAVKHLLHHGTVAMERAGINPMTSISPTALDRSVPSSGGGSSKPAAGDPLLKSDDLLGGGARV